jgi:hypothetical protein
VRKASAAAAPAASAPRLPIDARSSSHIASDWNATAIASVVTQ